MAVWAGAPGRRGSDQATFPPGALMPVCPAVPCDVVPAAAGEAGLGLLGQAEMVAVRVADLAWPARPGPGAGGRGAPSPRGCGWMSPRGAWWLCATACRLAS